MSGIGLLLSTAKDALLSQQLALDVVSHNIANVNTPGYSRQMAELSTRTPAPYAGMLLGRGVHVEEVSRNVDAFIEKRLQERKSDLMSLKEKEIYMNALEGIFNENSDRSLTTVLADFWNAWSDVANNPSGSSERNILYERGELLCESLNGVYMDMANLTDQLNLSLEAAVDKVNELAGKIADLNQQILAQRINGNPNDLLDKRNQLITELSEYLDVRYYENDDQSVTVTTGRGYVLVSKSSSYHLEYDNGDIRWESSGAANRVITETITGGKMGGWLDMRDEIIPEYKANLNEFAKNLMWQVNQAHSLGVGLQGFSSVTGTYGAINAGAPLDSSGLDFQDKITDGSFSFWVYDSSGNVIDLGGPGGALTVAIDADTTTVNDIASALNGLHGGNISASVNGDGKLVIEASGGDTFAFSGDTSGALAALGINTIFKGSSPEDGEYARFISMNPLLERNKDFIAAGRVGASGELSPGDNVNALAMAELEYEQVAMTRYYYDRENGSSEETVNDTIGGYLYSLIGSVGIRSQSIIRSREYNEVITNELAETRDNISAVSLDEEMTNIIKYQHAYSAAARLVSVADEMFKTLLDIK